MPQQEDLARVLTFLGRLRRNNNRPWFEAHRTDYEAALADFEAFVGRLIVSWGREETLGGIRPKDCIMRIYRDIRFSADKTPYKRNFAAHIGAGGRKSPRLGYYVHVEPRGESLVAGGLYAPTPPQLTAFRQAIAADARPFRRILANRTFKKHFGALEGDAVKTVPKGIRRDHPDLDLLRLKQVVVWEAFPDTVAGSSRFHDAVIESFRTLRPFLDYLNAL